MFSPAALPVLSLGGALPDAGPSISGDAPASGAFAQLLAMQPAGEAATTVSAAPLTPESLTSAPASALPDAGKILPVLLPGLPVAAGLTPSDIAATGLANEKFAAAAPKMAATAAFLARHCQSAAAAPADQAPAEATTPEQPAAYPAQLRLAMMALGRHGRTARAQDSAEAEGPAQTAPTAEPESDPLEAEASASDVAVPTPATSFVLTGLTVSEGPKPGESTAPEPGPAQSAMPALAEMAAPVQSEAIPQAAANDAAGQADGPAAPAAKTFELPPLPATPLTAASLSAIAIELEPVADATTPTVALVQHQAQGTASGQPTNPLASAGDTAMTVRFGNPNETDGQPSQPHHEGGHTADHHPADNHAEPATVLALDAPALSAGPVVLADTTSPVTAPVTTSAQAERPADFTQIVDRLVAARDAAGTDGPVQPVRVSLQHAEFGRISLKFEQDRDGLSVSMTSADPAFAQAVQTSTLVKAAQETSGDSMAGFTNGQSSHRQSDRGADASGGFGLANSSGQPGGQSGGRQTSAAQRDNRSPAGNPSHDSDKGPAHRRRGLFA